jgi:hypothetical protein
VVGWRAFFGFVEVVNADVCHCLQRTENGHRSLTALLASQVCQREITSNASSLLSAARCAASSGTHAASLGDSSHIQTQIGQQLCALGMFDEFVRNPQSTNVTRVQRSVGRRF